MTNIPEFYVYKPSRKEVKELLKRMVANGIPKFDGLKRKKEQTGWASYCNHDVYECWGYNGTRGTFTGDIAYEWAQRAKELTMDEARVLLPLPSDNEGKQQ